MQLIDDIEEAVAVNGESFRGPLLRENWPRIKAALLAGEEMAAGIELRVKEEFLLPDGEMDHCARRFRAATQGPDAAAIGRAS